MTAVDETSGTGTGPEHPPVSTPARQAARRFLRNKLAVAGAVFLTVAVVAVVFADQISGFDPTAIDLQNVRQAPSSEHWLGTDDSGRDVFSRLLHAGRISLWVGFASSMLSLAIGTILGALSGLLGGWVDSVVMRAADIVMSFPSLVVMIVLAGILGPSVTFVILAIGLFGWPNDARIVRGVTLTLREREFLQASRAAGAGTGWILFRHIIPGALGSMVVVATLGVAGGVLLEASLSFLGLGVQPPQPSWGNMLNDAQSLTVINSMPWLWIPPGVAVALVVLSVNFVGDGLRDAVDPRQSSGGA